MNKLSLHTALIALTLGVFSASAQTMDDVKDTLRVGNFRAHDHLLQKPLGFLQYEDGPQTLQHFYWSAGGGAGITGDRSRQAFTGQFALGSWITPVYGWRLHGGINTAAVPGSSRALAITAGADMVINLSNLNYDRGYNPYRKFELLYTFGLGAQNYTAGSIGSNEDVLRYGVNTSLQARYFVDRPLYVFVEPQFSMMYGQSANGVDKKMVRKRFSPTTAINVGFGYQLLYGKEGSNWRNDPFERKGVSHMFFGAGGGFNARVSGLENKFRLTTMAFVGKMFSPISGLRLNMMFNQVRTYKNPVFNVYQNRYTWTTGLDYVYALNSAFGPYDNNNKIDLRLLVGPTMTFASAIGSRIDNPDNIKVYPGAEVGLSVAMRVCPNWYFYVEPMMKFFSSDYSVDVMRYANNAPTININAGLQYNVGNFEFDYEKAAEEFAAINKWQIYIAGGPAWRHFSRNEGTGGSAVLGLQRKLSPVSALRLSFDGTRLPNDYIQVGSKLSYLFDMTTPVVGYDPNRLFTFSAVMGLDAGNNFHNSQTSFYMGAHAGFQTNFQLSKTFGLFFEPQLLVSRIGIENPNRLAPGYRVLAGLSYTMTGNQKATELERLESGNDSGSTIEYPWVFALGGGINSRLSNSLEWRPMGSLSATYNFSRYAGARLGVQYLSTHDAREYPSDALVKQYLSTTNLDFLFNLNSLFVGYSPKSLIQPSVVLGGVAAFSSVPHQSRTFAYPGIEAGLNLGIRLSDHWGLYVEPLAQFFTNSFNHEVAARSANLPNLTLTGGVAYSMATPKRKITGIEELEREALSKGKEVSRSPWFFSLGGGLNTRLQSGGDEVRPMAGIATGWYLGNYSAIRLGAQYQQSRDHGRAQQGSQHNLYTLNLDYLFDAKKLILGSDRYNRYSGNIVLGGILAKSDQAASYPGFEAGLNLGYHLSKHFTIFAEPMMQFYTQQMNREVMLRTENNALFTLNAGLAYSIAPRNIKDKDRTLEELEHRNQRKAGNGNEAEGSSLDWFASIGGGINTRMQVNPSFGIRPMASIAAGCSFAKYSAVRFGLQALSTRSYLQWPEMVSNRQDLYTANLDYLFNVKKLLMGEDRLPALNANVVAGGLLASSTQPNTSTYPAVECGLNVGYNISKQISVFAEPMVQFYTTEMNNRVARFHDNVPFMTVSAGVTYTPNVHKGSKVTSIEQLEHRNRQKSASEQAAKPNNQQKVIDHYTSASSVGAKDFDWNPQWFASIGGGINTRMQINPTFGVHPVRPMASIALGCSFANYSTVRMSLQYQKTRNYLQWPEMISRPQSLFTANLDYLFNLKNLLVGKDRLSALNVNAVAGGVLAKSTQPNTVLYPGLECGANVSYDISKKVSVYAEPMFQFYSTDMNNKVARFQDNVTFMTVSAGLSYKF